MRKCGRIPHITLKYLPASILAKKDVVKLGWDSQSSKKLKGKLVEAGAIGVALGGGGRAPGYALQAMGYVDDLQYIVVPSKRQEAARIIAEHRALLLWVRFAFGTLLYDGI